MIKNEEKIGTALSLSRNAARVKRFHTMHLNEENTVGQHTFNLIGILLICVPPTALRWQLLAAAWQHDVPEAEAGDVPSPTKRALGGMDAFEAKVLDDAGMHDLGHYLHGHEMHWLKLADSLEGWMKCVDELNTGNRLIVPAANNFRNYVTEKLESLRLSELERTKNLSGGDHRRTEGWKIFENFKALVSATDEAHSKWEADNGY